MNQKKPVENANTSSRRSLFHARIIDAQIQQQPISSEHKHIVHEWITNLPLVEKQDSVKQSTAFIKNILCDVLGYHTAAGKAHHTVEEKTGQDDYFNAHLGEFKKDSSHVIALLKLAGPASRDLDAIASEEKTILDQARQHAKEIPNAQFLLISNLDEIRFYSLNRKQNVYELFSLKAIATDPAEYQRFYLILNAENMLSGQTTQWMHESAFTYLHDKLTKNHPTLKEAYGSFNQGITGVNDAFIIDKKTWVKLIKEDPKSAEILKPFLEGRDLDKWVPKSPAQWLIYTPKGQVNIDLYPAIKQHLLNFKEQLEKRGSQQEWFELDDAQVDRQAQASKPKIGFAHKSNELSFAWDASGAIYTDCSYFTENVDYYLSGLLHSTTLSKLISKIATETPDGMYELHYQHIEALPIPDATALVRAQIGKLASFCQETAKNRRDLIEHFCGMTIHNFSQQGTTPILSDGLQKWYAFDFAHFRNEVIAVFGNDIPEKDLALWEAYLEQEKVKVYELNGDMAHLEHEINSVVHDLFELDEDEIAFIEKQ